MDRVDAVVVGAGVVGLAIRRLAQIQTQAARNGVHDLRALDGAQTRALEPELPRWRRCIRHRPASSTATA